MQDHAILRIKKDTHKEIKTLAAMQGMTMTKYMEELVSRERERLEKETSK